MKRIYLLFLMAMMTIVACSGTTPEGDKEGDKNQGTEIPEEFDVYLLIGQSNAAGRGELTEEDTEQPIEGVWLWNTQENVPEPALQPLNIWSTIRKGVKMQKYNLAGPFAAKVHKETGRPVLLVVNARGATMLGSWLKTSPQNTYSEKEGDDKYLWGKLIPQYYAEAVRLTKLAMEHGTLKGILWHQGCGNSSESNSATYLKALNGMVTSLRNDLGCPDVPFVAGQLLPEFKNAQYFNPMILTIGESIDNAFCATSEDCVSIGDGTHFNRESLIMLGERYADIILKEVYGK